MTDNNIVSAVILTTLIILLLVAGITLVIFMAGRQHLKQQAQLAILQAEYEKELRTVESEVQEQVMENIASELHDNIGQLLTVMHLQIENQKYIHPESTTLLQPVRKTLSDTIKQVRLLSRSLNNDMLEQNGLLHTIQTEVDRLQHIANISIHWEHDGADPSLSKDKRLMAFRIFQELINNAMKHSKAQNIYITLRGRDAFMLQVQDDGIGFDSAASHSGAGLRNMSRRATMADIHISMRSVRGAGTSICLT